MKRSCNLYQLVFDQVSLGTEDTSFFVRRIRWVNSNVSLAFPLHMGNVSNSVQFAKLCISECIAFALANHSHNKSSCVTRPTGGAFAKKIR